MKCENGRIRDLEIAYIGGGSRGWAWTFMTDLALEPALSGNIRLYDIDREAAKQNELIGNMVGERQEAVRRYAPNAWVINYTNPMALCVRTLYETFPEIKAYGCCHEVFGTQKLLKSICEQTYGVKEIDRRDIVVNVMGLNHFTWFDKACYAGNDLMPVYSEFVEKHYESGYEEIDNNWMNNTFTCAHRVKFDLFRRYGLIAAAGDRHLAEFMPGEMYLKNPETVAKWKFGLTTVAYRKKELQERLARSRRLGQGQKSIELKATGEEGILLIKTPCGLTRVVSNVNLPNRFHQISNLPEDTVVETNVVFSKDSVQPIAAGKIPENMKGLFEPHVENQATIMKAALTKEKTYVYEAFEKDPLVSGRAGKLEIQKLADDMIENTKKYLPQGW